MENWLAWQTINLKLESNSKMTYANKSGNRSLDCYKRKTHLHIWIAFYNRRGNNCGHQDICFDNSPSPSKSCKTASRRRMLRFSWTWFLRRETCKQTEQLIIFSPHFLKTCSWTRFKRVLHSTGCTRNFAEFNWNLRLHQFSNHSLESTFTLKKLGWFQRWCISFFLLQNFEALPYSTVVSKWLRWRIVAAVLSNAI